MSKQKIWVGLEKEFEEAKKSRNVLVKVIISDSTLSDSHFYKVISGERKPGDEKIEALAKALSISPSHIKKLLSENISEVSKIEPLDNKKTINKKFILLSLGLLFIITLTYLFFPKKTERTISNKPISENPKIKGDDTKFLGDITYKDGTQVLINTQHEKIWRLKNSGTVPWKNRFLKRITAFSDNVCHTENMISIKDTKPGEEVDISSKFTTMQFPGSCLIDWKMTDEHGEFYFPNKRSMYFEVNVTDDASLIK